MKRVWLTVLCVTVLSVAMVSTPPASASGVLAPARVAELVNLSKGAKSGELAGLLMHDSRLYADGARLLRILEAARAPSATIAAREAARSVETLLRQNPDLRTFLRATEQARVSLITVGEGTTVTSAQACLTGTNALNSSLVSISDQITLAALGQGGGQSATKLLVVPGKNGPQSIVLGPGDTAQILRDSRKKGRVVVTRAGSATPETVKFDIDPEAAGITQWSRGSFAGRWTRRIVVWGTISAVAITAANQLSGDKEEDVGATPDDGERSMPPDNGEK